MIRRVYIQCTYIGRSFPRHVRTLSVTYRIFLPFFTELVLAKDLRLLGLAITSNRRRIDPHLLFVFINLYKNTRNQTQRSCCVLFILPSVAGPYSDKGEKERSRREEGYNKGM